MKRIGFLHLIGTGSRRLCDEDERPARKPTFPIKFFRRASISEGLGVRAQVLRDGGVRMRADFMDELRVRHLGITRRRTRVPSVIERLQAA